MKFLLIVGNKFNPNFEIQWKALKDKKDEDDPEEPKITKALPIIKWTEAFQDFLNSVIGARMIPLAYVIELTLKSQAILPHWQSTSHIQLNMDLWRVSW